MRHRLGLATRTQISVCKSPFPSAGTAVSLFRAKTVQQRPLLPREVETWKLLRGKQSQMVMTVLQVDDAQVCCYVVLISTEMIVTMTDLVRPRMVRFFTQDPRLTILTTHSVQAVRLRA